MCGIHASISINGFRLPSEELKSLLCNRGPDSFQQKQAQIDTDNGTTYWISLTSTVLSLRGGQITVQPFIDPSTGSLLCWNGEAWRIGSEKVNGNDGETIFQMLISATSVSKSPVDVITAVLEVLQSISGPFAFVFLDRTHGHLYLGRDRLGRRSLLYKDDADPSFLEFSSISDPSSGPWQEVEADAIYQFNVNEAKTLQNIGGLEQSISRKPFVQMLKHMWNPVEVAPPLNSQKPLSLNPTDANKIQNFILGNFNRETPTGNVSLQLQSDSVKQLHHYLQESLKLRILDVPSPPSFGNESFVRVAVLFSGGLDCTVLARMAHDILPPYHEIDLINVAFENPRVVSAARNRKSAKKERNETDQQCASAQNHGPPIEENPFEHCPDRETGRRSFQELQTVCPNRRWRFVAVNVPYTEAVKHRPMIINLLHPHKTEMDLSIAYALYFSARGSGLATVCSSTVPVVYTTPARVLLSGLGADELFGGYTRHATAFNRSGFSELFDELKLDIDRLGKRNLGRDDRVISHWGREARFPYLDENFVKWAVECPIWQKTGFYSKKPDEQELPVLEAGKKVLRLLAYDLGMQSVAKEKKRAIQFGARTAKMETGKTKGTSLIV